MSNITLKCILWGSLWGLFCGATMPLYLNIVASICGGIIGILICAYDNE